MALSRYQRWVNKRKQFIFVPDCTASLIIEKITIIDNIIIVLYAALLADCTLLSTCGWWGGEMFYKPYPQIIHLKKVYSDIQISQSPQSSIASLLKRLHFHLFVLTEWPKPSLH